MRLRSFYRVEPNRWLLTRAPGVRAAQLRAVAASHETEAEAKEYVRQWVLRELIDTYRYPAEWLGGRIVVDERVQTATTVRQADISLKDDRGDIFLCIETRPSAIDTAGLAKAQQHLEGYLVAVPTATIGMLTSATTTKVIRKKDASGGFEVIRDIPSHDAQAQRQPVPPPEPPPTRTAEPKRTAIRPQVESAPPVAHAPRPDRATPGPDTPTKAEAAEAPKAARKVRRTRTRPTPAPVGDAPRTPKAAVPTLAQPTGPEAVKQAVTSPRPAEPGQTAQLLRAAAVQANAATDIEIGGPVATSDDKLAHRSFVFGAILQAVAALESEIWAVVVRGPGHHLGHGRADETARRQLSPLAGVIDEASLLDRYQLVLQVLQKDRLDPSSPSWQDAGLAVRLRGEIVRRRLDEDDDRDRIEFLEAIRSRNHPAPPFVADDAPYFPDQCLSAACARWVVRCCTGFVGIFYDRLGLDSPLAPRNGRRTP